MTANPAVFTCPDDTWVKVATAITTGTLHKRGTEPRSYVQTYRLTGNPAPTDDTDAARLFGDGKFSAPISSTVAIDVYVKARGADGEVRVDL